MSPTDESPFRILDFMPGGCCILGEEARILHWNRTLEAWTGLPASAVTGRILFEAIPHLEEARFRDRILASLASGTPTVFSSTLNPQFFRCQRPDGAPRIQQTTLTRLPFLEGGIKLLITATDVTDQFERGEKYRAARAVALEEARVRGESEARHRIIVDHISDAIFVGDGSGAIRDCNTYACDLFAFDEAWIQGRSILDLVPPSHQETLRGILSGRIATGDGRLEILGQALDGRIFPLEISAKRFRTGDGDQFVLYLHDLSDRRRSEDALRLAHKQESLAALAGGVAHDFNNLFTSVLGNLEIALGRIPPGDPLARNLGNIRTEILRATELSRKMLAFSGKGRFDMGSLDLNQAILDLEPRLGTVLSPGIRLVRTLADGLPPIEADPGQIQQVLLALLANASEAHQGRDGLVEISTGLEQVGEHDLRFLLTGQPLSQGLHATVGIRDTGCGIAPEHLPRIFDPFFTTKATGRGLSLAVALGILRSHKAGYTLSSQPGEGTVFTLYFPVLPRAVAAPELGLPERRVLPRRVLLVDDEPLLREATTELLESLDFEVASASDGLEAVDYYRSHPGEVGLVLMDLTMPNMGGREAFFALKELDPEVQVILSSGYSETDVAGRARGMNLAGFLQKPYRLADLEQAIAHVLG